MQVGTTLNRNDAGYPPGLASAVLQYRLRRELHRRFHGNSSFASLEKLRKFTMLSMRVIAEVAPNSRPACYLVVNSGTLLRNITKNQSEAMDSRN